jgi:hypothetical protein
MNNFKTEYLIVIDKNNTSALYDFLNSNKRFNELLEQNKDISIRGRANKITFKNITFDYTVKHGEVDGKEQKYFYLTIGNNGDLNPEYKELLKAIKKNVYKEDFILETLQDDLSFYYSQQAYSLIHEIENYMRKFITFFMIAIVGKDWFENSTPKIVKDAIEKSKRNQYSDVLQKLDFKHLGDVLFGNYQNEDNSKLLKKISSYKDNSEIDLEELKGFVPSSNWHKFFKGIVDCDDTYLKSRWNDLYDLRNIVAHTSSLSEDKYLEIKSLVSDVQPKLIEAFEKLNTIKLKSNERLEISERIAKNVDKNVGHYFEDLNDYEMEIRDLIDGSEKLSFEDLIQQLKSESRIDSDTFNKIEQMMELKSKLIFESVPSNKKLSKLNQQLGELKNKMHNTWSKDVYQALKNIGGKGTWEDIYESVSKTSSRNFSTSWQNSVRKAIYTNSSDADLFDGRFDIYKKINKGFWMIRKDINEHTLKEFLGNLHDENT